jgi:hypothetical protein
MTLFILVTTVIYRNMTILNCVSAGPIKRFSIKIVAFFHNWQHNCLGLVFLITQITKTRKVCQDGIATTIRAILSAL